MSTSQTSGPLSPDSSEVSRSLIPVSRVQTPPALRKMYPKDGADKLAAPNRNVVRKATFTKLNVGVATPDNLDSQGLQGLQGPQESPKLREKGEEEKPESKLEKIKRRFSDIKEKLSGTESDSDDEKDNNKTKKGFNAAGFPLPGAALFAPIDAPNRSKAAPSKEMRAALKVLNDSIGRGYKSANAQGCIH